MTQEMLDAVVDAAALRRILIEFEFLMIHGLIPADTENSALAVQSWDMLRTPRGE